MGSAIFERLKKIIVDQLGVEEKDVVPTAKFAEDLGADSLDLVELIMAIEEHFSTPGQRPCQKDIKFKTGNTRRYLYTGDNRRSDTLLDKCLYSLYFPVTGCSCSLRLP